MTWSEKMQKVGRASRWSKTSASSRLAHGKYMRYCKGRKHATQTLRAIGNACFMRLCKRYKKQLGRVLTPSERAHIRVTHKAEIDATKVGMPYVKRPRANYPSRD